jgi:preprotein translocase subunit YajC
MMTFLFFFLMFFCFFIVYFYALHRSEKATKYEYFDKMAQNDFPLISYDK